MDYSEKIQLYDKIAENLGLERKGKTMPYTSANGHMFSQINKEGELGIRFPEEVKETYMKELNTSAYTSYGSVMKGYVLIPELMWEDPEKIAGLLKESHEYVMTN
jgi:hypothetical protein